MNQGMVSFFRIIEFNIFSVGWKIKSYGDEKIANVYRFRKLTVVSHRPTYKEFGILVAVLLT